MIHQLRLKTINGLLRLVAWMMGVPKPCIASQDIDIPAPAGQPASEGERYFVSYTFTCAWPHHNSPIRVPGGFGDCVITMKHPLDTGERINAVRAYITQSVSRAGNRSPCVIILSLNRLS